MLDIYVINIKERSDRWNHILKTFGNDFNLINVEAIKHQEGWKGCFLSHKKCLNIAKEKGLKNIIVMEDDCNIFCDNFVERLMIIKKYLDNNDDWYIFLGGTFKTETYNVLNKIKYENINLLEISYGYCMHFVIYNNKSYDYILDTEIIEPIDHVWPKLFNAIISIPFIATQIDNYSDIENKVQNSFRKKIKITNKRLLEYSKKI
jgi:GR25 family glycosyltransferase involved in LPS biosynthesis